MSLNLLGGDVRMDGLSAVFCPEGYYVPNIEPGTEPCKRVNFNQPGFPQQSTLSWEAPGAELRTTLPEGAGDLTGYASLHLRAALDPLSYLNPAGQPASFSIELMDANGARAHAIIPPETPALAYPMGERVPKDSLSVGGFTGLVHMSALAIPLANSKGSVCQTSPSLV